MPLRTFVRVVAAFLERLQQRRALVPWLVFALGIVMLAPAIWSETSVTCSDEYVLTFRTPMEMNERGQWLTPWCNEQPRLRKPPLMYWLILAAYKALGTNLIAARLWGVLAGAGLGVVACLMERQLSRGSGLLAGLLALASVGVAATARQAMLDLPLALFASLAVLQFLRWLQTPALGSLLLSAMWLGLSFLVKGPVGILFFATAAVAGFWVLDRWPLLRAKGWHWALWLLVLAVICLPWPLAMQYLWSDRFVQILGEELAERKFGNWAGKSPLSALGGALGLIFPWTLMGVVATWQHFRAPKAERCRETAWLIGWILLSVTPFFFMKAFERYMLAVLPAQAVLASIWLQFGRSPAPVGQASRLSLTSSGNDPAPETATTESTHFLGTFGIEAGDRRDPCPTVRTRFNAQAVMLQISAVTLAVATLGICGFLWWFHLAFWLCLPALVVAGWTAWRSYQPKAAVPVALGAGVLWTVLLGGLYPTLGLSFLPPDTQQIVGGRTARIFADSQPSLLSMRLGYSVQGFDPAKVAAGRPEAVFVEDISRGRFEAMTRSAGLATRELAQFRTLYSRKAWSRFARQDATAADWREAFRQRSLEALHPGFLVFEVTRPAAP